MIQTVGDQERDGTCGTIVPLVVVKGSPRPSRPGPFAGRPFGRPCRSIGSERYVMLDALSHGAYFSNEVGEVAARLGEELCPDGFRLISNTGRDAMQSQHHGHVHIIGGFFLGPYA